MNLRPRPALTLALATALAGTAPPPVAADDTDEPTAEHCYTYVYTPEELEAGAVMELECYPEPLDAPQARSGTITLAIIYDISNTTGDSLALLGTTCTGASVTMTGALAPWDNRIGATTLVACGSAKHWTGYTLNGSNQLLVGNGYHTLNATLNNQTSSIEYAP